MLRMDADETLKKIKKAKTDADRRITYDPEGRPEVANLLTIASQAEGRSPEEIAEEIGDRGAGTLKLHTAEVLNEHLAPIRAQIGRASCRDRADNTAGSCAVKNSKTTT